MRFLVVAIGLSACAQGGKAQPSDAPEQFDSPPGRADARVDSPIQPPIDASCPRAMAAGPHLLISEVTLTPAGHEFIEIDNPTGADVDLTHYYLADNSAYYKLPAGAPNLGSSDFIAHFPAGSTIAAHSVITVATGTAATFNTAFGANPTYSVTDGTIMTVAVNGAPTLTDAGELVALFYWDGTSALVFDVDMVLAGVPSSINGLDTNRGGYAQLGCTYATDADTMMPQASAPAAGKSTKRIALETGHQASGGNGLTGDDETSEDTSATWDTTATFSAPTPGTVPAAIQ
jgi:hypothetical protein